LLVYYSYFSLSWAHRVQKSDFSLGVHVRTTAHFSMMGVIKVVTKAITIRAENNLEFLQKILTISCEQ